MRTAVLRGLRPTTLTHRRRNPLGKWSELDLLLLEAYQSHEEEQDQKTGLPIWVTRDDGLMFNIEEGINYAEAALADFDKAAKGPKGDKEPPAGLFRYVAPTSDDGSPVPEGGIAREEALRRISQQMTAERGLLPGSTLDIERKKPAGGYDASDYG